MSWRSFIIVFLITLAFAYLVHRRITRQYQDNLDELESRLLKGDIIKSLRQMDTTCSFYKDEDEANRELATCLKLLGHDATYHYPINTNRTVDIFVDNSIIEGKLDPDQQDIDRLIRQISDFVNEPYDIYVVIYGYASPAIIERINDQLVTPLEGKVSLIYLDNPQRTRIRETSELNRIIYRR